MEQLLLYYFIAINVITSITFIWDKIKASVNSPDRISELTFHTLELFGGCFSTFIFINLLNHKKAKMRYKLISYSLFTCWVYVFWLNKELVILTVKTLI
ncbi:MAG: DUF1294 domain-containing protein [Nanoarchaeales archaeon]|nr:DUF1294 domain-containing protein [Nanoarchaeales archaeon]